MSALVRAELLKLRTVRSSMAVLALTLAVAALLGAAAAATAGTDGSAPAGSAASLVHVIAASGLPALAAYVLGVVASAGEVQHRTLTQTYLTTPRRGRVLAAKALTLALVGAVLALAVTAVALAASLPPVLGDGAPLELWHGAVARAVGGNLLAGPLFAVMGVAAGVVLRNQLAAVLLAAGWALLGEGIIAIVAGAGAVRWFPGAAARALTDSGPDLLALPVAVVVTTAYALALLALARRITLHQDLT